MSGKPQSDTATFEEEDELDKLGLGASVKGLDEWAVNCLDEKAGSENALSDEGENHEGELQAKLQVQADCFEKDVLLEKGNDEKALGYEGDVMAVSVKGGSENSRGRCGLQGKSCHGGHGWCQWALRSGLVQRDRHEGHA